MTSRVFDTYITEGAGLLGEGVITSVTDANIGSVFGIEFPPWSGGVFQFVNQYGLNKFIARAENLANLYGERCHV